MEMSCKARFPSHWEHQVCSVTLLLLGPTCKGNPSTLLCRFPGHQKMGHTALSELRSGSALSSRQGAVHVCPHLSAIGEAFRWYVCVRCAWRQVGGVSQRFVGVQSAPVRPVLRHRDGREVKGCRVLAISSERKPLFSPSVPVCPQSLSFPWKIFLEIDP